MMPGIQQALTRIVDALMYTRGLTEGSTKVHEWTQFPFYRKAG